MSIIKSGIKASSSLQSLGPSPASQALVLDKKHRKEPERNKDDLTAAQSTAGILSE